MKRTTTALLRVTALTLVLALPSVGIAAPPVKSNVMFPIDVVVEGNNEDFAVHGTLHVVTEVRGTSVQIHTNLANTIGVGLTSGQTSHVTGSQSLFLTDVLNSFGDGDIEALAFFVIMQAAKSAQEDLKAIMAKVKYYNRLKLLFASGVLITVDIEPLCDCSDCDDGSDGGSD